MTRPRTTRSIHCIFVTGTDTNVGKTYYCTSLLKSFVENNVSCAYYKPIQSGLPTDLDTVRDELTASCFFFDSLYSFKEPASPNQAAELEIPPCKVQLSALKVDLINVLDRCLDRNVTTLIIEGAGGLRVPFDNSGTDWIDYLRIFKGEVFEKFHSLNFSIHLVARSGLGTLNHTRLTLDSILNKGFGKTLIVLNGENHPKNSQTLRGLYPTLDFISLDPDQKKLDTSDLEKILKNPSLDSECIIPSWLGSKSPHCWHPYRQHLTAGDPLKVVSAEGGYLTLFHPDKNMHQTVFDAVGSWWTSNLGHGHPRLREAVKRQHATLDHALFASFTHKPAEELAEVLCHTLGEPFQRVFFSDNGSTAVEVAMKMAVQRAAILQGVPKKNTFAVLKHSYHGDTFGAMSVAGEDTFRGYFKKFLFPSLSIDPVFAEADSDIENVQVQITRSLQQTRAIIEERHEVIAAFIVEPILMGAGGMRIQDRSWLEQTCALFKEYSIPIIFDEVFTGMGRTGKMFAFQHLNFVPDYVCLAKGLTGGALPMSVTLTSEEVFSSFATQKKSQAFLHGHSFTGSPLGCALALETFKIYEDEKVLENVTVIENTYKEWIESESAQLELTNLRCQGSVLAGEVAQGKNDDYFSQIGEKRSAEALKKGVFLRPLGPTFYLTPPLNTPVAQLKGVLETMAEIFKL